MNKSSKIFVCIIIILIAMLVVMTYLYLNMKDTAKNNLDELLKNSEQYSSQIGELNKEIEELKEQVESKNSISSISNEITNSTKPYIPDGVTVADPNDNPGTPASDLEFNRSPENVTIEVLKDTITRESAEILITDNNEDKFGWGEDFKLQKKVNEKWEELETVGDNLVFNAIAYKLNDDNQLKLKVNYGKYYGVLEDGIYRIVKPVYDNEYIDLYSNEFEIK